MSSTERRVVLALVGVAVLWLLAVLTSIAVSYNRSTWVEYWGKDGETARSLYERAHPRPGE
jgi:hypothetical protein